MILDPIDQGIRDQGFNFVPFDRYLASPFQPKTLDMSGGISTLKEPILPIINQNQNFRNDGGGGGGGAGITNTDTSGFDYETEAYGLDTMSAKDKGLTQEEQDALDDINNPSFTGKQLGMLGLQTFFNPLGAAFNAYRIKKKNEEAALERSREAAAKADFDRAMKQGRDFYDTLNDGRGASVSDQSREQAGPGFSDVSESGSFMNGGIVDLVDIYD